MPWPTGCDCLRLSWHLPMADTSPGLSWLSRPALLVRSPFIHIMQSDVMVQLEATVSGRCRSIAETRKAMAPAQSELRRKIAHRSARSSPASRSAREGRRPRHQQSTCGPDGGRSGHRRPRGQQPCCRRWGGLPRCRALEFSWSLRPRAHDASMCLCAAGIPAAAICQRHQCWRQACCQQQCQNVLSPAENQLSADIHKILDLRL